MANHNPTFLSLLRNPVHLLAFGFGSGLARKAPGTWGTLAGLVILVVVYWLSGPIDWLWHLLAVLVATLVGIYLCGRTAADLGVHDHGGIVWDEFVGFWLAMLWVPVTWYWLLLAFVLFRGFDIIKPWPIRWIDQRVGGGFGIMLDDLLAGVYTLVLMQASLFLYMSW